MLYPSHIIEAFPLIRERRRLLLERGYKPISVHSPWSNSPGVHAPGKQPVKRRGETREEQNWTLGHTAAQLDYVTWRSCNTGLLTEGLRIFDCDIDLAATLSRVRLILAGFLPAGALVRYREGSPRVAIVVRAEAQSYTFAGITSLVFPEKLVIAGEHGKVEVLGFGQQVLVDGWHPSDPLGHCRWYFEGAAPWDIDYADLPLMPEARVEEARDAIIASGLLGDPLAGRGGRGGRSGLPMRPGVFGPIAIVDTLRRHIEDAGGHVDRGVLSFLEETVETQRHDNIVSCAGFLVAKGWRDKAIFTLMVKGVRDWGPDQRSHGDWRDGEHWEKEIQHAIDHARSNQKRHRGGWVLPPRGIAR